MSATVTYDIVVDGNDSDPSTSNDITVRHLEPNGDLVAEGTALAEPCPSRMLFSGSPVGVGGLYELLVDLGGGADTYPVRFGIRTVEVDGNQFLINGEPFYLQGFGMHETTTFSARATTTHSCFTTLSYSSGLARTPSAPCTTPTRRKSSGTRMGRASLSSTRPLPLA